jgi:hypothetical protein
MIPTFLNSTLNRALVNVNHSRWQDTIQNHKGLMCFLLVQYCGRPGGQAGGAAGSGGHVHEGRQQARG